MFAEDIRIFFRDDGVTAKINGKDVLGLFDNGFAEGLGVAGTDPFFTCAAADVDANPVGQSFVLNGVTYEITQRRPDGRGMVTLDLEEQ